jgi:hypothetical protein
MRKNILSIIISFILMFCVTGPAVANGSSAVPKGHEIKADNRAVVLRQFVNKYDSKLADSAEDFVAAADYYGLDWRMLPAISGIESTFGKQMIEDTYNAYGWGGGTIHFKSWSDGIWTISKAIKEKYVNRGADTIFKIGPIYCPPNPTWPSKVQSFMDKIEATTSLTPNL